MTEVPDLHINKLAVLLIGIGDFLPIVEIVASPVEVANIYTDEPRDRS